MQAQRKTYRARIMHLKAQMAQAYERPARIGVMARRAEPGLVHRRRSRGTLEVDMGDQSPTAGSGSTRFAPGAGIMGRILKRRSVYSGSGVSGSSRASLTARSAAAGPRRGRRDRQPVEGLGGATRRRHQGQHSRRGGAARRGQRVDARRHAAPALHFAAACRRKRRVRFLLDRGHPPTRRIAAQPEDVARVSAAAVSNAEKPPSSPRSAPRAAGGDALAPESPPRAPKAAATCKGATRDGRVGSSARGPLRVGRLPQEIVGRCLVLAQRRDNRCGPTAPSHVCGPTSHATDVPFPVGGAAPGRDCGLRTRGAARGIGVVEQAARSTCMWMRRASARLRASANSSVTTCFVARTTKGAGRSRALASLAVRRVRRQHSVHRADVHAGAVRRQRQSSEPQAQHLS